MTTDAEKKTTTVALLGGTGGVGGYFLDYALERGYKVRMLCRSPDKVDDSKKENENLTLLQGDATSLDDLKNLVDGSDALVSCLGNKNKNYIMEKNAKVILEILENSPSLRVVFISSLGMGGSSPVVKGLLSMINVMIGEKNVRDYEAADGLLTGKQNVVVVRPDALGDGPGKGAYRAMLETGMGNPMNGTLSKQDVALFFADLLEDTQYDGKAVQLYTAKK